MDGFIPLKMGIKQEARRARLSGIYGCLKSCEIAPFKDRPQKPVEAGGAGVNGALHQGDKLPAVC